jgi:hypothetical protein
MRAQKVFLAAACAALAGALAVPAVSAPLQVISVKVRVESQNGATRGDFDLGDTIAAKIGEQLKVSLVGGGMINGASQEVPIHARFNVAAGGHNLSLLRTGPSWAIVSINGAGGNGLGQLGYATTGNYQIKPGLASGRITFRGGGAGNAASVEPGREAPPQGYQESRWHQARALNALLERAILGEEPRGDSSRADVERIYREGYGGALTVATALARAAEDRGLGRAPQERGYEERDVERVGGLYRDLLHRQQGNRDLLAQDPGFRGNVHALHERGLPFVVSGLVDSDEFRSTNPLSPN